MGPARRPASWLTALALCACGGGGGGNSDPPRVLGSVADGDSAEDAVSEAARPGTPVGITVTAPELAARGAVTFSLTSDSNGAFKVDAATGVVTLLGSVDYEVAAQRTFMAKAASTDGKLFAERNFTVAVIDSPAPDLAIDFPFAHASYAYTPAGVGGRILHPDPASVSVRASAGSTSADGVVAADGRFFVRGIPVGAGERMTLTVTASHAGNEAATRSVSLGRSPELSIVNSMIVDQRRDRYLLADRYSGTIVAIARNGYARSIVSGAGKGAGIALEEPMDLALDTKSDRLYVVDSALRTVMRVDPVSGDRTIVGAGNTGTSLLTPVALAFDAGRGRLLVADDGRDSLFAVDPATGARTVVSDNSGAYGPTLHFWDSLEIDAPANRAIMATVSIFEQYQIDLTSGARTVFSDMTRDIPNPNRSFTGLSIARARGAAYFADDFSNAVVRMDLFTGARTSITSSGLAGPLTHPVIGTGPELEWPTDVLYDEAQDRLFVIEEGFADPLIEVDEATGNRTLLTNAAVGAGINFKDPWGITLDPAGHTAYVVDQVADIVVAVSLEDGSRRLIAGSPTGRGTIATSPLGTDVDAAAGQLYVVDFSENSLYALDVASGARRTISDAVTGTGPLLDNPIDVAVDSASGLAYVLDAARTALFAVNLAGGDRRIVAGSLTNAGGLAFDTSGVAYVTRRDDVVRIDLASGQPSVVGGAGPRPGDFGDVALDAAHGRLIALDLFPNRVLAIDLATGAREVVSGPLSSGGSDVGGGPSLELPREIRVDSARQIAYVTDALYDAVIAVDLASGYRQIVAR